MEARLYLEKDMEDDGWITAYCSHVLLDKEFKLCYIEGPFAYFTTQLLADQWGDDWDDAPYEHNAGLPYEYSDHDKKMGRDPWEIEVLPYRCNGYQTPAEACHDISVKDINRGHMPWLMDTGWGDTDHPPIHAGVTMEEFIVKIHRAGGDVFERIGPR